MLDKIKEILDRDKDVVSSEIFGEILYFKIEMGEKSSRLFMRIDKNFPKSLPYLFTPSEEMEYPHKLKIDIFTRLCFANHENTILSAATIDDTVNYTLYQVKRLLNLSKHEVEIEFQNEFLYFFNKLSDYNLVKLFINPDNKARLLEVNKTKNNTIVKDINLRLNDFYVISGEIKKAIYIPLKKSEGILPPNSEVSWDNEYLIEILNKNISYESYEYLRKTSISSRSINIVFKMKLPNEFEIMFMIEVNFCKKNNSSLIDRLRDNFDSIKYIWSIRCDKEYLLSRVGIQESFYSKKVLIVGCGSLGSYIADEMPKIGINNITLVDDDVLESGNIFRHSLGFDYIGLKKIKGVRYKLERNFPEIIINTIDKEIVSAINDGDINLMEYDLIIVSTGGTDKQIELNKLLREMSAPNTIYTWIEPYGQGIHALVVNHEKEGCFQCLYFDEQNNLSANKAHFISKEVNSETLTGDGCGGSFNPYGNRILLEGTALILELVIEVLSNQEINKKNLLHSIKNRYNRGDKDCLRSDISYENLISGTYDYINTRCEICGKFIETV